MRAVYESGRLRQWAGGPPGRCPPPQCANVAYALNASSAVTTGTIAGVASLQNLASRQPGIDGGDGHCEISREISRVSRSSHPGPSSSRP